MALCSNYYMIDALAGDVAIRKRKYRRDDTAITSTWYDYNGDEVTDADEIARLDAAATDQNKVDKAYDDHEAFMTSVNKVSGVVSLPMDKHNIICEIGSTRAVLNLSWANASGLEGDSYYILLRNNSGSDVTINMPTGGNNKDHVGYTTLLIDKDVREAVKATFLGGGWIWEFISVNRLEDLVSALQDEVGDNSDAIENLLLQVEANTQSINNINTKITGIEKNITDINTNITNIEGKVTENTNSITEIKEELENSGQDLTDLEGRVTAVEKKATTNATDINTNKTDIADLKKKVETNTQSIADNTKEIATVRAMVEGKTSAYIFETKAEMDEFLSNAANTAKLKVGDSLWIKEQDVPDYWWAGTEALEQEGEKINLSPYATIGYVNGEFEKRDKLIQQCLFINVTTEPDSSLVSYTDGDETVNFTAGAVVKYVDEDGNPRFYKLVSVDNGKATWFKIVDTRYGNVTLESVYDKDYEIVNITDGSRIKGVSSDVDMLKIVNSASGNVTVEFDADVASGVKPITSLLASSTVILTPGAAAELTKAGDEYKLTQLFGVTIFPDLADSNREGEWAVTVGVDGRPILMEIKEMRKWDESIVREMTIDELNEKFPDVEIGFTVVCKTIDKAYEMVNAYKEWVSYDITSLS